MVDAGEAYFDDFIEPPDDAPPCVDNMHPSRVAPWRYTLFEYCPYCGYVLRNGQWVHPSRALTPRGSA